MVHGKEILTLCTFEWLLTDNNIQLTLSFRLLHNFSTICSFFFMPRSWENSLSYYRAQIVYWIGIEMKWDLSWIIELGVKCSHTIVAGNENVVHKNLKIAFWQLQSSYLKMIWCAHSSLLPLWLFHVQNNHSQSQHLIAQLIIWL